MIRKKTHFEEKKKHKNTFPQQKKKHYHEKNHKKNHFCFLKTLAGRTVFYKWFTLFYVYAKYVFNLECLPELPLMEFYNVVHKTQVILSRGKLVFGGRNPFMATSLKSLKLNCQGKVKNVFKYTATHLKGNMKRLILLVAKLI